MASQRRQHLAQEMYSALYRFEIGNTFAMHGLRAQQSLLLKYKTWSNEETADDGEDNANDLNGDQLLTATPLNSLTLSLLLSADRLEAAEDVAAAAVPVAVADDEEDIVQS
jgi:hypothetical protein